MTSAARNRGWRFVRISAFGALAISVLTLVGFQLHLNALSVSSLFLIAVAAVSLAGDFAAAAVVSVMALGCLDFFFIPPLYTFRTDDPMNTVALLSSLLTALVITRLVSKVRTEAREARLHRGRLEQLYQLARQLLAVEPRSLAEDDFLERFLGVFGVKAVCLFDSEDLHTAGTSLHGLAKKTRDAFIMGSDLDDEKARISVRRLRLSMKETTATIGFEGLEDAASTAGPLTALAATFLDRMQALRKASDAAAAQTEIYRSAVLDALAHEFKTPLATILAAAGGIREAGPLAGDQSEMAETVENEAIRLGTLTSQLLRMARLNSEEIKPRIELIDVAALAAKVADQYAAWSSDRRILVPNRGRVVEAAADPELLRLTVSQLIENACKYSQPGSTITVETERADGFVRLRVSNSGSSIPKQERNRIFERFYRGTEAQRSTSGSGLGLYVARKIALAHRGTLELEAVDQPDCGVTFCLKIAATKDEPVHATSAM